MKSLDTWGLDLTAPSADSGAHYCDLVEAYVAMTPDLPDRLGRALQQDPAPLSEIVHGYFSLMAHTAAGTSKALEIVDRLEPMAPTLNDREILHLSSLTKWANGSRHGSIAHLGTILEKWPHDMLAARLQHFELFSSNDVTAMLESAERLRTIWTDDMPYKSYLDGMTAFALEELGHYGRAEDLGRGAVAADPADLWSIHAVAHVLEMQGRVSDGIEWLEPKSDYLEAGGSFSGHVWWHLGLYHLANNDIGAVFDLLDTKIAQHDSVEGLTLSNTVSMLARLDFAGVDVGDRWANLVDPCSHRIGQHSHPFNDCHYAYALSRAGRIDLADELTAAMTSWAATEHSSADVITAVALDTARGMAALGAGQMENARDLLGQTAAQWNMLGGSNAQRDLFTRALARASG